MGYKLAGFDVVGVDIKSQPNYPFTFIKNDVMEVLEDISFLNQFDIIHASPPCQGYSSSTKDDSVYVHYSQGKQTPKLIEPVRQVLVRINKPYIIENVYGARKTLINPIVLTGYMFGMPIKRRRLFECNFPVIQPIEMYKRGYTKQYALENKLDYRDLAITGKSRRSGSIELWKRIMGMEWANRGWELTEAIPPVYTQYIGNQFIIYDNSKRI